MPLNPDIVWAVEDVKRRAPAIQTRQAYREGHHRKVVEDPSALSPNLRVLLEDLADNLCDDVVDEPLDRLAIRAWTGKRATEATEAWEANKGHARATSVFGDAWCAGDGWLIREAGSDGVQRFHVQNPAHMAVRYSLDNPDRAAVYAKVWPEGKAWRLNLYYGADDQGGARLERYATRGSSGGGGLPEARAFQPYETDTVQATETAAWDQPPVYHFPAGEVGRYGRSVLTNVIPLQDLLNKSIADMVVAMEDVALPQRVAIAVAAEYNDDGTERPLRRRSRRASEMLRLGSAESRIDQFDGADLSQFLTVQEGYRQEIARKGYLPLSSVGLGDAAPASGIAMLVAEGRQVKRVKRAARDWGYELRRLMADMLTASGVPCAPEDLDLEWERPETRDETALWELAMVKRDLGVPIRQILLEGGYDAEDVDLWLDTAGTTAVQAQGGRISDPGGGQANLLPDAPPTPAGAPASAPVR